MWKVIGHTSLSSTYVPKSILITEHFRTLPISTLSRPFKVEMSKKKGGCDRNQFFVVLESLYRYNRPFTQWFEYKNDTYKINVNTDLTLDSNFDKEIVQECVVLHSVVLNIKFKGFVVFNETVFTIYTGSSWQRKRNSFVYGTHWSSMYIDTVQKYNKFFSSVVSNIDNTQSFGSELKRAPRNMNYEIIIDRAAYA